MIADALSELIPMRAGESYRPPASDDYWYMPLQPPALSGVQVTPETAMRVSAVYACVRVLAETIATLPLHIYKRRADGGKERAPKHPLYDVLHDQPNEWQTAVEFFEMMMGHLCLRGNAYAEIIAGPRGSVDQLIPLHPDRVLVERLENGRLRYTIRRENGVIERLLTQDGILHVRGLSSDGIKGLSPVESARESIGLAMAEEMHGAASFGHGARPGGVIQHPGNMGDKEHARFLASWEAIHRGPQNAGKTAILEEGMKWQNIGMTLKDALYIDARKFQVVDIARVFRVPPHMIQSMDAATYGNIEHESIDFAVFTIRPWLVRWEQAFRRDLIQYTDRYFAEFLIDALLRGDAVTRSQALQTQFLNGALTIDEWRAIENRNPLPDKLGEQHFVPLNLQSVEKAAAEEEEPEPPAPPLFPPPQPAPPPPPENEQNEGAAMQATQILLQDAAKRIVNAELREVEAHLAKASDDPERFKAWADNFYEHHYVYVITTLTPIARSAEMQFGTTVDTAEQAQGFVNDARLVLFNDTKTDIKAWMKNRRMVITESLFRAFGCEGKS